MNDEPNKAAVSLRIGKHARWSAVAACIVLLLSAAYWAVRHGRSNAHSSGAVYVPPPEDPRLAYAGPFQNIHPDVAYVGDEKCATCHLDKARTYREHPMGRSLLPIARSKDAQRYDAAAHNPFDALGTQFVVARQDGRLTHRQMGRDDKGQAVYQADTPIDYVLGSGLHGYAYLTDRDGYLFQSPVSWFSQKQIWDKSPGFGVAWRPGRPITAQCLYCHANHAQAVDGTDNRYEQPIFAGYAIGCERCHGPGQRHVADPGHNDAAGIDPTIVNPRHLSAELRADVCEQCHLAGDARVVRRGRDLYDYRPGLPLYAFLSIFVRATDPNEPRKAVSHVEQMVLSTCFLKSADDPAAGQRKLGCVSCHDPHQHVATQQRAAHYRSACLKCHQQRGCSLPEVTRRQTSRDDSCIDCHMPRYASADIPHTASTDHRILRRPDRAEEAAGGRPMAEPSIVPFHRGRHAADDLEDQRDLGIALAHVLVPMASQRLAAANRLGRQAVGLLENAIQNDPDDIRALESRAKVLALLNRSDDALEAYEAILAKHPSRELSLLGAAVLAQNLQEYDTAIGYWRRVVVANPWQPSHRAALADLLARRRDWDEALAQARVWLRLDPANLEARILIVGCLLAMGDKAAAREEFALIERLRPPNLQRLRARFMPEMNGQ